MTGLCINLRGQLPVCYSRSERKAVAAYGLRCHAAIFSTHSATSIAAFLAAPCIKLLTAAEQSSGKLLLASSTFSLGAPRASPSCSIHISFCVGLAEGNIVLMLGHMSRGHLVYSATTSIGILGFVDYAWFIYAPYLACLSHAYSMLMHIHCHSHIPKSE